MLGTFVAWLDATGERAPLPVGVVLLGAAALGVWRRAAGWTEVLAAGVSLLVAVRLLGGNDASGSAIAVALQGAGAVGAIGAVAWSGLARRRRAPKASAAHRARVRAAPNRDRGVAIASLLLLSATGAELLAAYSDSTGRPGKVLFAVVFFAMLYGCPALLIREAARRTGRAWPTILLVSAAAGLLQAGIIDQSLFTDDYGDVKGWEESLRATYIAPLGFGGYMLQNFVLGHVVYSFCAPIALAEALRPGIAHRSWLGRRGIAIAGALWLLAAAAILADTLSGDDHGTLPEVGVTLTVVVALVVVALRLRPVRRGTGERTPSVPTVLILSFLFASMHASAPETWVGVAIAVPVAVVAVWLLARAARGRDWGLEHSAAVAAGVLLSRGALAFLYYPVVGETSAGPKYAHNVVMVLIVAAAAAYAIRRAASDVHRSEP
jgi:hypothetical protein